MAPTGTAAAHSAHLDPAHLDSARFNTARFNTARFNTARFNTARAAELIRRARQDAGLTQAELAQRAGLRQPSIAQMESGTRSVSAGMLERVLRAADYRPSLPLGEFAADITGLAERHGLTNVRVFGSATRGDDGFDSDIDLLVSPGAESDLFDIAIFTDEVERLTGFPVDVVADTSHGIILEVAMRDAVPL